MPELRLDERDELASAVTIVDSSIIYASMAVGKF
jgi:hypothetical protein